MLPEPFGSFPAWLLTGVALGGLLAVGAAAVFLVGVRFFPDRRTAPSGPEGGERLRRAEVRRYLEAIDEPFLEDHRVGGLEAAFFLPRRGIAITFDARDYFRFDRAGIPAVLLEYELPGSSLGDRLPFDTPGTAAGGGPERESRARWRPRGDADGRPGARAFAALGLPVGASEAAVREAYRERVKDVHPDHGGDAESFRRLREAYAVARELAE